MLMIYRNATPLPPLAGGLQHEGSSLPLSATTASPGGTGTHPIAPAWPHGTRGFLHSPRSG